MGLPEPKGENERDIVYILLFDKNAMEPFGIRETLKVEDISKTRRTMLPLSEDSQLDEDFKDII
jgi:hypothetical protein